MADDKWTTVKTKRKAACKGRTQLRSTPTNLSRHIIETSKSTQSIEDDRSLQEVVADCRRISQSLGKSSFFDRMMKEIINVDFKMCHSIVALGIGQFSSSPSAILQLAMLLCIQEESMIISGEDVTELLSKKDMNIRGQECIPKSHFECKLFDPLFSLKEIEVCCALGLLVSDENRRGKHSAEGKPTIFFMPHCPYRLYVNLLWENWNNLPDIIILGNSFCSYGIRRPIEDEKTDCMRLLGNLVTEIPVWDLFTKNQPKRYEQSLPTDLSFLENAFCDLSIHYFKRESLDSPLGRQILNHRPLEKDIDEAALLDIELFG